MDDETLTAYCSIVAAISEDARGKAVHDDAYFRKYFPHLGTSEIVYSNDYMSTFENVADALERLNIMKPLDRCCSTFACEPQHEYELAKVNWSRGPSFSDLFEAFIDLFGEFGTEYWGFGTSPGTPFKPKGPTLASAMTTLVAVGYADTMNGGFRWTDKARPAMVAKGFWSGNADD